jgi:hypothetical protein
MNTNTQLLVTLLGTAMLAGLQTAPAKAQCAHQSWNGYCPEKFPRAGEQRLNAFQYIGSHNAYQRLYPGGVPIPLDVQLDDYGHRHIELDIRWTRPNYPAGNPNGNDFWIQHLCVDTTGSGTIDEYLLQIANSQALQDSFIVVNLDILPDAHPSNACFEDMPSTWKEDLEDRILQYIPEHIVYTQDEFESVDDHDPTAGEDLRIPSVQELLRRGKHIMFIGGHFNYTDEEFFFDHQEPGHPAGAPEIEIRSDDHTATFTLDDRFISTYYAPDSIQACSGEAFSRWEQAVQSGFTFPTTYCPLDGNRLLYPLLHPPIPTYVTTGGPATEEFGTWGRPYHGGVGLLGAINRIALHESLKGPSDIPVRLSPGTYDLDPSGANPDPVVFNSTMTLESSGGIATITK